MSQTIEKQDVFANEADSQSCDCDKRQCAIGIASVAIGIGGFVLASLL